MKKECPHCGVDHGKEFPPVKMGTMVVYPCPNLKRDEIKKYDAKKT